MWDHFSRASGVHSRRARNHLARALSFRGRGSAMQAAPSRVARAPSRIGRTLSPAFPSFPSAQAAGYRSAVMWDPCTDHVANLGRVGDCVNPRTVGVYFAAFFLMVTQ
jgi:hypothetical protein